MRNALAVVGAVDIHLAATIGAIYRLCPAGAAGGGGKVVCFPLIAEEITEYLLPESCFLAALKFFEKFFVLGESFFDFLYLYK